MPKLVLYNVVYVLLNCIECSTCYSVFFWGGERFFRTQYIIRFIAVSVFTRSWYMYIKCSLVLSVFLLALKCGASELER